MINKISDGPTVNVGAVCPVQCWGLNFECNRKAIFNFQAAPAHINCIGLESGLDIKRQNAPHSSENQWGVTFYDFTEEL